MSNQNSATVGGFGWWLGSAILLAVIITGCLGGHRYLVKYFDRVQAVVHPLTPLMNDEAALRKEITRLMDLITREKRRCIAESCGGRAQAQTRTRPQTEEEGDPHPHNLTEVPAASGDNSAIIASP